MPDSRYFLLEAIEKKWINKLLGMSTHVHTISISDGWWQWAECSIIATTHLSVSFFRRNELCHILIIQYFCFLWGNWSRWIGVDAVFIVIHNILHFLYVYIRNNFFPITALSLSAHWIPALVNQLQCFSSYSSCVTFDQDAVTAAFIWRRKCYKQNVWRSNLRTTSRRALDAA